MKKILALAFGLALSGCSDGYPDIDFTVHTANMPVIEDFGSKEERVLLGIKLYQCANFKNVIPREECKELVDKTYRAGIQGSYEGSLKQLEDMRVTYEKFRAAQRGKKSFIDSLGEFKLSSSKVSDFEGGDGEPSSEQMEDFVNRVEALKLELADWETIVKDYQSYREIEYPTPSNKPAFVNGFGFSIYPQTWDSTTDATLADRTNPLSRFNLIGKKRIRGVHKDKNYNYHISKYAAVVFDDTIDADGTTYVTFNKDGSVRKMDTYTFTLPKFYNAYNVVDKVQVRLAFDEDYEMVKGTKVSGVIYYSRVMVTDKLKFTGEVIETSESLDRIEITLGEELLNKVHIAKRVLKEDKKLSIHVWKYKELFLEMRTKDGEDVYTLYKGKDAWLSKKKKQTWAKEEIKFRLRNG